MVMNRATGELQHHRFFEIENMLRAGDVLVFNVSKVFKARLLFSGFEVFVLAIREGEIDALVKPGKKCVVGSCLALSNDQVSVTWGVAKKTVDGVVTFATDMSAAEMLSFCDVYGKIPTPPYVSTDLSEEGKYQTAYAKVTGSVAAPTAGFHFTPELLERLRAKGVQMEEVVLHVGIGTFRPVQVDNIEDHVMHAEEVMLDAGTAERLNTAKREGRRIIAVGTTTTRVLEGIAAQRPLDAEPLASYAGPLNLFITPGFQFRVLDGLITNFHLPKSTLLMLVSAFSRREYVMAAYENAKREDYRFFSFGDAMLFI